jgi:hypothetical protein
MGTKAISGDVISTITNKKKLILGLTLLGILAVFLAGCAEQQNTASAQTTTENTQLGKPQDLSKNPENVSFDDRQMPPQDGNFSPGARPNIPPEGNFTPRDGQIPPQDGNFTPGVRPDFPKDGNFAPPEKKINLYILLFSYNAFVL